MAGTSSSYADRISRQFEQQFGRPADANDPAYAEYIKTALPQMIEADHASLKRSQHRWGIADKAAMAAAISLLGYGGGQALGSIFGGGGTAAASADGAGLPAGMTPGGAMVNTAFPVDAALEGAAVPTAAQIAGTATKLPADATAGIGFDAAGAPTSHAMSWLRNISPSDIAKIAAAGFGTVGAIQNGRKNQDALQPNTLTNDPNIQQLLATMQGRLNKSEPLFDSVMSMANGLLPTQYQKGGGGMS